MADVTKTVEIIFAGVDKTAGTIGKVTGDIDKFAKSVQSATQPLADMAKKVIQIEAALGTLAVGGMALAVVEAGKFKDSTNEIFTLLDINTGQFTDFKDEIKAYAGESTQSIESINQAIYNAISAGVKYSDAIGVVAAAEKLAVAGRGNLNDTTKVLVSTMNAYGAGTNEITRYSDVLFQTVKSGQTTLQELSASLSRVTAVAGAGGVPIETLGAAVAALTSYGMPTSEAMTAIKSAIEAIIAPTAEAKKMQEKLGLSFSASSLKSKGFEGVLKEIFIATKGDTEQIKKLIGSSDGLKAALLLGADMGGKFKDALEGMKESTKATDKAFEKMSKNMNLSNQKFMNKIKLDLIKFGDELEPLYGKLLEGLGDVFKGLGDSVDKKAFDPIFEWLEGVAGKITEFLQQVAKAMPEAFGDVDWSEMLKALDSLGKEITEAFNALFAGIDLTTPEGLTEFIQKIVDGFRGLTQVTSGVVAGLKPFLGMLGQLIDWFTKLDPETQKLIGQMMGLGLGINKVAGYASSLTSGIGGLANLISTMATKGSHAAQAMASLATSIFGIGSATGGATSAITALIGSTAGKAGLLGIAAAAGYAVGTIINEYVPGVKEAAQSLIGWTDKMLNWSGHADTMNKELEGLGKNVDLVKHYVDQMPEEVRVRIEAGGPDAKAEIAEIIDKLREIPVEKRTELFVLLKEGQIEELKGRLEELPVEVEIDVKTDQAISDTAYVIQEMQKLPEDKKIEIQILLEEGRLDEAKEKLKGIPSEQPVEVIVQEKETRTSEIIRAKLDKIPKEKRVEIEALLDRDKLEEAQKALDAALPKKKKVEVDLEKEKIKAKAAEIQKSIEWKAKIDIAEVEADVEKFKAKAAAMQTVIEWKAKLDIAGLEAKTERIKAAFEGVGKVMESTGTTISSLVGAFTQAKDFIQEKKIEEWINREYKMRKQAADDMHELTQEQIKMMQLRTDALEKGEGLIKITAAGLEPELEAFMWKILEKVQIRASEEQAEFLLGIPAA